MRIPMFMAAAAAVLGFGFSQPASAGGWDRGCCGDRVFIHHHVYYPPRFMHVYHHHRPIGARHLNVVHYDYACCGYFAPRRRYYWRRYW